MIFPPLGLISATLDASSLTVPLQVSDGASFTIFGRPPDKMGVHRGHVLFIAGPKSTEMRTDTAAVFAILTP